MQTIERTTLSELVGNEQYARKVLPFIRGEYFGDRTERIVFEEIQILMENKLRQFMLKMKMAQGIPVV